MPHSAQILPKTQKWKKIMCPPGLWSREGEGVEKKSEGPDEASKGRLHPIPGYPFGWLPSHPWHVPKAGWRWASWGGQKKAPWSPGTRMRRAFSRMHQMSATSFPKIFFPVWSGGGFIRIAPFCPFCPTKPWKSSCVEPCCNFSINRGKMVLTLFTKQYLKFSFLEAHKIIFMKIPPETFGHIKQNQLSKAYT